MLVAPRRRSISIAGWTLVTMVVLVAVPWFILRDGSAAGLVSSTVGVDPPARAWLRHEPISPIPPAGSLDPAKVALGRRLFHEPRLSADNTVSCASCHDLAHAGVDRRSRSNVPRRGQLSILAGGRRAPNPAELLSGHSFKDLIADACQEFDRVVLAIHKVLDTA